MTYFPDKPWNIGDEFENETTGVTYRYDGTKWVATGDSEPNLEYVAKSGDTMTGRLNMEGDIRMSQGTHIDGLNADGQNFRMLTFEGGSGLTYKASTNNEYSVINRKAMESYVTDAIDGLGGGSSYTPPYFYQSNLGWNNINRPGLFGLEDRNGANTTKFEDARAIWFTYTDKDGNEPFLHARTKDWTSYFSEELYIIKDDKGPIFRIAQGSGLNGYAILDGALNSLGIYYIGWEDASVGVEIGEYLGVSQGGLYQLHIPGFIKY